MANGEGGRYPNDPLGAVIGTDQADGPPVLSPSAVQSRRAPEWTGEPAAQHGLWAVIAIDQNSEGVARAHEIQRALPSRDAAFDVAVRAAYSFGPGVPQFESGRRVYGCQDGYLVVCDGTFNSFPFRVHVVQELDLDD